MDAINEDDEASRLQRLPLDGPPAKILPLWGRRVEFEHFLIELVPRGPREFNVKLGRTFASINFSADEGTSSLAGDRLRPFDRRPFEYIIVPPGFPLKGRSCAAPEVLAFVLDFPALQVEIETAMGVAPGSVGSEVFMGAPDPFAAAVANRIRKQLLNPEPPQLYLESLCVSLLVEMFDRSPLVEQDQTPQRSTTPRLRMLVGYIDANLESDLSVAALARLVGATKDQLNRAFSGFVGQTPHAYVVAKRIDRARTLIDTDDAPLAEIAAATGFSSQSHMTTVFKQHLGRTPGALRRAAIIDAARPD